MQHNEEMENLALLYSYGELDSNREGEFLQHLKDCPECQNIIRLTGIITAAMPEVKAPDGLCTLPLAAAEQPKKQSFLETIAQAFSFKRLVPAGAMMLIFAVMGITAFKLGSFNTPVYDTYVDGMYAEITDIEDDIDDLYAYFDAF